MMVGLNNKEIFDKIKKAAIFVQFSENTEKLKLGRSKFGGNPHLPKSFDWYEYEGTSYEEITEKRTLSFLAQINLTEVASLDVEHLLPPRGILYFFYEVDTMKWGFDPKDKGCAKVYYYDGAIEALVETTPPKNLHEDYVFPEMALSFLTRMDLPHWEEFSTYYGGGSWDEYGEAREQCGYPVMDECDSCTKLLGYADIIQNEMLMECEKVTRGIYCGDGNAMISEEKEAEIFENSKDWILLFQMGTVEQDDFELMWGDCGNIYFFIKKQDLAEKNFDHIWLILQCS